MEVSVLQWNVWYKENIKNVVSFLKRNKADIICLQELTRGYIDQTQQNTWEYLSNELDYDYHYRSMPIITDSEEWFQANAIFTKFPIVDSSSQWINVPEAVDDRDDQYRAYIEVAVKVGERKILVGNTHTSYPGRFSLHGKRKQEIDKLMYIIDQKKSDYILCGDLNAEPESSFIKMLSQKLKHAGPPFEQKTWTTKPHTEGGYEALDLDWRLDYIFVTQDVEVLSSEVLKTDVSDHLPIIAKLKLT